MLTSINQADPSLSHHNTNSVVVESPPTPPVSDTASPTLLTLPPARQLTSPNKATNVNYTRKQILVTYGALFGCVVLASLDITILGVAAPSITNSFNDFSDFAWISSAYLITSSAATPLYGRLSDLYGRRCMMEIAIALFFAGSIVCATATSMLMLIVGRAIQGCGGAGLSALTQTIVGDMVAPSERGKYQGLLSSAFGIFSVAGPVIGGGIISGLSWQWVFWINLPVCAIVATIIFVVVRIPIQSPNHKVSDIDWLGSIAIVAGAVLQVLALTYGGVQYSWSSWQVLVPLILSFCIFGVFLFIEHRTGDQSIIPLSMFRIRNYSVCVCLMFLYGASLFGLITYIPNYFQIVYGDSATISGLRQLPLMMCFIFSSICTGQSVARTGKYSKFPLVGSSISMVASAVMAGMFAQLDYWAIAVLFAFQGVGLGMCTPVIFMLISNSIPLKQLAVGVTSGTFVRALGGAVGSAVVSSVLINTYLQQLTAGYAREGLGQPPANAISLTRIQLIAIGADLNVFEQSYRTAMQRVFAVVLAFNVIMFAATFGVQHVELRGRKVKRLSTGTDHCKSVDVVTHSPPAGVTNAEESLTVSG